MHSRTRALRCALFASAAFCAVPSTSFAAGGADEATTVSGVVVTSAALPPGTLPLSARTLDAETILHRLYWEEPLARFEPFIGETGPRFACRCNRERVGNMIRSLGTEEVEGIIAEQGQVEVGCDFCGAQYRFDPVDAAGLFTGLPSDLPPGSVH